MAAYYNEYDPYAAQWLRNLIAAGHLPEGDVDTRSIVDVEASDLQGYAQCHFFAGVGGWPLAARLAGWPDDRHWWSGSCPCQPFSQAGRQKAETDQRHLWPHFRGLIAQRSPAIVVGEQVASRLGRAWLTRVRGDLETMGYAVGAADLCAAGVGAPHIRQRLWWLGHARGRRREVEDQHRAGGASSTREREAGLTRAAGAPGTEPRGLGHADDPGLQGRSGTIGGEQRPVGQAPARGAPDRRGRVDQRMADPERGAAERHRLEVAGAPRPGQGQEGERQRLRTDAVDGGYLDEGDRAEHGGWGLTFVQCTDGKSRRVEPSIQPLAHGVSGRVGRLRAYGNAIVPQVAAAFLTAAWEAIEEEERDER